jgi:hypothetical protein
MSNNNFNTKKPGYMDTTQWWKDAIFGKTPGAKKTKELKNKSKKELKEQGNS